jgi:hypothetical protein
MKVAHVRYLPIALLYAAFIFLTAASPASADTKPYFKTYGDDVMSGGWFHDGINCSTGSSSNYQDPTFSNAALSIGADSKMGGILTYANNDGAGHSTGGASSQFGVRSLGAVDGDTVSTGVKGFYSDGAQTAAGANYNALTFANNGGGWGGNFEGAYRWSNCIPDYYSQLPPTATNVGGAPLSSYVGTSDYYKVNVAAGSLYDLNNSGPVSVGDGKKVRVFVNSDVYIKNNIIYGGGNDANNMPKFVLVVKGSIYIDPSVTRLDGFYIAQPNNAANAVNTDTGIIWTCHPDDQNPIDYTYPANPPCSSTPLVVNGALVAKQINFLRGRGNVAAANTGEDTLAGGLGSGNIAEIINYTPQMVIGGGFFDNKENTASGLPIDSIVSLPPVF